MYVVGSRSTVYSPTTHDERSLVAHLGAVDLERAAALQLPRPHVGIVRIVVVVEVVVVPMLAIVPVVVVVRMVDLSC